MKVKLSTEADEIAFKHITGLQSPRSLAALIAALARRCDPNEDFECIIQRDRLQDSYRSNPSLFAQKIKDKTDFVDASGYQTPDRENHISILLFREKKAAAKRRFHPVASVKQQIKDWLDLNEPRDKFFTVKLPDIPAFYFTHPEQLSYQIKRESCPIRIVRMKNHWRIFRK